MITTGNTTVVLYCADSWTESAALVGVFLDWTLLSILEKAIWNLSSVQDTQTISTINGLKKNKDSSRQTSAKPQQIPNWKNIGPFKIKIIKKYIVPSSTDLKSPQRREY